MIYMKLNEIFSNGALNNIHNKYLVFFPQKSLTVNTIKSIKYPIWVCLSPSYMYPKGRKKSPIHVPFIKAQIHNN